VKKGIFFVLFIFASAFAYSGANWFIGNWEGDGIQVDGLAWNIKLTVRDLEEVQVDYPDLICSGTWNFIRSEAKAIYYTEYMVQNTGGCVPVCDAVVERQGTDGIKVTFILASYHATKPFATAELKKVHVKK
jgi:hypothetical protein